MKKTWRALKGVLLFLVVLGIFTLRMLQGDTFMLSTLEIDESEHITPEVFIDMTEIITHQNILRYDLSKKGKIIDSHPYIQATEVQRKFPNTLEIKLKEREEYAIIPYDGKYLFVDRELFLLKRTDAYLAGDIPVLRDVNVTQLNLGERVVTENDKLVKFTFEAYEALSVSDLFPYITELYLIEDALIIETTEQIDVVLGREIDLPYTVVATQEVFEDLIYRNQRNVSIVSKYKDYIFVESGTLLQQFQSKIDEEQALEQENNEDMTESEIEPSGDNE